MSRQSANVWGFVIGASFSCFREAGKVHDNTVIDAG